MKSWVTQKYPSRTYIRPKLNKFLSGREIYCPAALLRKVPPMSWEQAEKGSDLSQA
jgi:hypothetical protein